ncbi:MAG: hypothetical protein FYV88_4340, partial [Bacteroidetes bacterium]|nr:hypothetical protein [Bacteroidota bacterium]
ETRNRIRFFHEWRPYVQTDHHEQGTNATHYFDPGKNRQKMGFCSKLPTRG